MWTPSLPLWMIHWWVCIWARLPLVCLALCAMKIGVGGEPLKDPSLHTEG